MIDSYFQNQKRKFVVASLTMFALAGVVAFFVVGCTAQQIEAGHHVQSSVSVKVAEAAGAWEVYDQKEIDRINAEEKFREDATKRIKEYGQSALRVEIIKAFNLTWGSNVVLDQAITALEAGLKSDVAGASLAAYGAVAELIRVLTKAGIKIPSALKTVTGVK